MRSDQIWENGDNKGGDIVLDKGKNNLGQENSLLVRQRMSNFNHTFHVQLWTPPDYMYSFFRLWIIIAKALGIKLHPNEKPITSAILHILTFGSAAGTYDIVEVKSLSNLFQHSLWPMAWYPGTVSCRSTRRKTSSMARSASWWCPSSVDWGFTLTGWHTGKTILICKVEEQGELAISMCN